MSPSAMCSESAEKHCALPMQSSFHALLPEGTVVVEATPTMWEGILPPDEEQFIRRAVPRRRREFTAGRQCARRALLQLGAEPSAIPVGPLREPMFPPGISGSITHTTDFCAAAVVRVGQIGSIGIDAESNVPVDTDIRRLIVSADEEHALCVAAPGDRVDPVKIAFSAKEAFYKAFCQQAHQFIEWRDARLSFEWSSGRFALEVLSQQAPLAFRQRQFVGQFRFDASKVYCAIALPPVLAAEERRA